MDTCGPFCRARRASWLGGPGLGEAQPPVTGLGTCADGTSWDSGHPGSPCQAQSPLLENPAGSPRPGLWCRQVQPGWAPGASLRRQQQASLWWDGGRGGQRPPPRCPGACPGPTAAPRQWRRRLIWFSQRKGCVKHLPPRLASGSGVPSVARLSVEDGPWGAAPGLLGGGPPWAWSGVARAGRAPAHMLWTCFLCSVKSGGPDPVDWGSGL